jgi:hypothetical protein
MRPNVSSRIPYFNLSLRTFLKDAIFSVFKPISMEIIENL